MKVVIFIFLFFTSHHAIAALFGEERNWEFIQNVGGVAIGKPILDNEKWVLPVYCNVSGIKKYTVKPTMLNSALVWIDTEVEIRDMQIFITIETSLTGIGSNTSTCGSAILGKLKSGVYKVNYLSPDDSSKLIDEIEIK